MSPLHVLLIAAGIVLVLAVIGYNRWLESRWRRGSRAGPGSGNPTQDPRSTERIEPTLSATRDAAVHADSDEVARPAPVTLSDADAGEPVPRAAAAGIGERPADPRAASTDGGPDREIECIVALEPVQPIAAGALAAGLHARVGKPLRWFGRVDGSDTWERLTSDSPGRYTEISACMLLADRNGAASGAQIEAFARLVGELAPDLPAACVPPDLAREAQRAEALDRLCTDLDVQIGVTLQKPEPATMQGTRLRGVAEAAGFRLTPSGRFEYVHEDTGEVLYALHNVGTQSFTAESLRRTATPGVVLVLDVARVTDPARAFDHMKLSAKRLATTLGATLVDDNRRPLDDAAFAQVREQVVAASDALAAVHIEPGSARALALFGA